MRAFLAAKTDYPGRDVAHQAGGRLPGPLTTRLKYRREDIEEVADFLRGLQPQPQAIYQKLVRAGIKQHPDSASSTCTPPTSRCKTSRRHEAGYWAA